MNKRELNSAYITLANASLESVAVKDRIEIIRLLRHVRPEAEAYGNFVSEIREKNMDIIGSPDPAMAKRVAELNKAVDEEGDKEVNIESNMLSAETFGKLLESNPKWNVAQMMLIEDIFVKK